MDEVELGCDGVLGRHRLYLFIPGLAVALVDTSGAPRSAFEAERGLERAVSCACGAVRLGLQVPVA